MTTQPESNEVPTYTEHPEADADVLAPDFQLENPTDDEEEQLQRFDKEFYNSIPMWRQHLSTKAREHLYEGAYAFNDTVDAISLTDKAFRYKDADEGVSLTGKLVIKLTPRAHTASSRTIKLYLDALEGFNGSAAELVAQITQDLFMTLKPQKVAASFVTRESGLEIRAQKTHQWGVGFNG